MSRRRSWLRDPTLRVPLLAGVGALGLSILLGLVTGSWLGAVMVGLTFFLAIVAVLLVRTLIRNERNELLHSGLREPPAPRERTPELELRTPGEAELSFEQRFRERMRAVRARHPGRSGLYQLPWWLVLGDVGSGKSALIQGSGLDVPAQPGQSAEPGSCGLVLAKEGLVIEAPGGWLRADRGSEEWRALLRLMRRTRPRCALNGVLLTVSAERLLSGQAGLAEHGRDLRRRLNELRVDLGVDVPIYVVVTHCDRLDGFAETARLLPDAWRAQALGFTNDIRRLSEPGEVVEDAIRRLAGRLDRLLPELLLREPDPHAQRCLFGYPEEVVALARPLRELASTTFASDAYGDPAPFLRGVYLTSSGSDGRVASTSLRRLGLTSKAAPRASVGPLFLRDLLLEVIAPDENLAVPDPRIGPLGRRGILAAATAASVWLLAVWGLSFAQNLEGSRELSQLVERAGSSRAPSLGELRELRQRVELDRDRSNSPVQWIGFDRLSGAAEQGRTVYVSAFRRGFERPMIDNLAGALRGENEGAVEALIALAGDLGFLDGRGSGTPPDVGRYRPSSVRDAERFRDEYARFVRLLGPGEIGALREERKPLERTAETLLSLPLLERITARPGGDLEPVQYASFRLDAPEGAPLIEGIYTPKGKQDLIDRLIGSSEERGVGLATGKLQEFKRRYSVRYLERWRTFLERVPIRPRPSAEIVKSPYVQLITAAEESLRVELPATVGAEGSGSEEELRWLQQLRQVRRSALLESEDAEDSEPSLSARLRKVVADFRVGDPLGKEAAWALYQEQLTLVQETLDAVVDAGDGPALTLASQVASGDGSDPFAQALSVVRRDVFSDRSTPFAKALLALLEAPILDGLSFVLASGARELDAVWRARVVDAYGSGNLSSTQLSLVCGLRDQLLDGELAPFLRLDRARPLQGDRGLPLGAGFLSWVARSRSVCRLAAGPAAASVPLRLQGEPGRVESPSGALLRSSTVQVTCAGGPDLYVYRSGSRAPHTFQSGPGCTEVALLVDLKIGGQSRELERRWTGPLAVSDFLRDGVARRSAGRVREWRLTEDGIVVVVPYQVLSGGDLARLALPRPPSSLLR